MHDRLSSVMSERCSHWFSAIVGNEEGEERDRVSLVGNMFLEKRIWARGKWGRAGKEREQRQNWGEIDR